MNTTLTALVIAAVFLVSLLIVVNIVRPFSQWRLLKLKRRLFDYSVMQYGPEEKTCNKGTTCDRGLLTRNEHKILLGILKKIEAKNGVLATIWTLFIGVTSSAAIAASSSHLEFSQSAAIFVFAGLPFLISSIVGARQIDNFSKLNETRVRQDSSRARSLQLKLMIDAIVKEELHWISSRAAVIYSVVLPILLGVYLFANSDLN